MDADSDARDSDSDSDDGVIVDPVEIRRLNMLDNKRMLQELGLVAESSSLKQVPKGKEKYNDLSALPKDQKKKEVYWPAKKKRRYLPGPHSHERKCSVKKYSYTGSDGETTDNDEDWITKPDIEVEPLECIEEKFPYLLQRRRKMRVLSFFDGIGTGYVALKKLGIDVEVYFTVEVDRNAVLVTMANHSVIYLGDILRLNKEKLKLLCPIDLVLSAPPCKDLSIVNPDRKGFLGSGRLLFKFIRLLRHIQYLCHPDIHVFWLMENTGHMLKAYERFISEILHQKPTKIDACFFSGQRRARNFWGNIPEMTSTDGWKNPHPDYVDNNIDEALLGNRKAKARYSRTITTSSNSHTITNGKTNGLVTEGRVTSHIWLQEIERLFGFPDHYTDVANLSERQRSELLGRAWSVPVIKHILSPLAKYYKSTKNEEDEQPSCYYIPTSDDIEQILPCSNLFTDSDEDLLSDFESMDIDKPTSPYYTRNNEVDEPTCSYYTSNVDVDEPTCSYYTSNVDVDEPTCSYYTANVDEPTLHVKDGEPTCSYYTAHVYGGEPTNSYDSTHIDVDDQTCSYYTTHGKDDEPTSSRYKAQVKDDKPTGYTAHVDEPTGQVKVDKPTGYTAHDFELMEADESSSSYNTAHVYNKSTNHDQSISDDKQNEKSLAEQNEKSLAEQNEKSLPELWMSLLP